MDIFINDVLKYVKHEHEVEKILALTIRDIFMNDLIYITFSDQWKQYDLATKK